MSPVWRDHQDVLTEPRLQVDRLPERRGDDLSSSSYFFVFFFVFCILSLSLPSYYVSPAPPYLLHLGAIPALLSIGGLNTLKGWTPSREGMEEGRSAPSKRSTLVLKPRFLVANRSRLGRRGRDGSWSFASMLRLQRVLVCCGAGAGVVLVLSWCCPGTVLLLSWC